MALADPSEGREHLTHNSSFLFYFLATPSGMWDLSSPTRGGTCAPCFGSTHTNKCVVLTSEPPGKSLFHNSCVVSPGMGLLDPGHMFILRQVTETKVVSSVDWRDLRHVPSLWLFWYYRGLTSPKPQGLGKAGYLGEGLQNKNKRYYWRQKRRQRAGRKHRRPVSPPHTRASEGRGHPTPSGEPTQNLRTRPAAGAPGLALRVDGDRA